MKANKKQRYAEMKHYGTRNVPVGYTRNVIGFYRTVNVKLSFIDLRIGGFQTCTYAESKHDDLSLAVVQGRCNLLSTEAKHMGKSLYVKLQHNGLTQGQQLKEYPLTVALVSAIVDWPARYVHWTTAPVTSKTYHCTDGFNKLKHTHTASQHSYDGCDSIQGFAWRLIKHLVELPKSRFFFLERITGGIYQPICRMITLAREGGVPDVEYQSKYEWRSIQEIVRHSKLVASGGTQVGGTQVGSRCAQHDPYAPFNAVAEAGRRMGKSWAIAQAKESLEQAKDAKAIVHYTKKPMF